MSQSTRATLALIRSKVNAPLGPDEKFVAFCPARGHEDRKKRSFSAGLGDDGRILLNCFTGCTFEQMCDGLGIQAQDCFPGGSRGERTSTPLNDTATAQESAGCTLEALSKAKGLPVDFLKANGLSQISSSGAPAVRIPYFDENGATKQTRYRISDTGDDRFRWKFGSKTMLYGWNRRQRALDQGFVVLAEGETDALTLLLNGIPSVSIPGADTWREERDAPYFDDIATIYVVIEPDKGGEAVQKWLAKSSIRDRVRLLELGQYKDPNALYLAVGDGFLDEFASAMDRAQPWSTIEDKDTNERVEKAWATCCELAKSPDILADAAVIVTQLGLTGEARNVKLMYLVLTSRLLERPVSAVVKGPSSAGKSFLVDTVLSLFAPDAYYALSGMSERALAYSEEPLSHRFLVIYEAAGVASDFATYLLRSLISEGCVRYETVEKTDEGIQAKLIEREGPTGVILTTTAAKLHSENETRLLSLQATDTPDHTKQVMLAIAELAVNGSTGKAPVDVSRWHALQEWLSAGPTQVVVPFAVPLAQLIPPDAVRLRRDFGLVITLIRAHALLHRASRNIDPVGRLEATLADYGVVRELVGDLVAAGVEAGVPDTVRETVHAARQLIREVRTTGGQPATIALSPLAKKLKLDKSTASRRAKVAIEREYLHNLEFKRGKPMRIGLGDPLPEERDILPTLEQLADHCSDAHEARGIYDPTPHTEVPTDGEGDEEYTDLRDNTATVEPHAFEGDPCPSCGNPMEFGQRWQCKTCVAAEYAQADLSGAT